MATARENDIDHRLRTGCNWALISQSNSFSLPHSDNGGVCTYGRLAVGHKVWAVRNPKAKATSGHDIDDIRYFTTVAAGDTDFREDEPMWGCGVIGPKDMLCVFLNAILICNTSAYRYRLASMMTYNLRHMVYSPDDAFLPGYHCYHPARMDLAFSGYLSGTLAGRVFTNAEHPNFGSIFSSFSTFWRNAVLSEDGLFSHSEDPGRPTQSFRKKQSWSHIC